MEKNILPWSKCLLLIADMSSTKEKISTHKLQKVLEHNCYEPILSKINKKSPLTNKIQNGQKNLEGIPLHQPAERNLIFFIGQ
ncbi:MAG: hypothetical protein EOM06_09140 [Sphingobacteriia bacterium]|nr:hypothetical protein [Sphingobacteriia bacterium]